MMKKTLIATAVASAFSLNAFAADVRHWWLHWCRF